MKGKFIVIEGGDGAGKDTQIELLKRDFDTEAFLYTREPGGTKLGKVLREMLLHETYGSLPLLTEAFLFLADRAQHVAEVVLPAIQRGRIVISNRSYISMIAYQLHGRDRMDLAPMVDLAVANIYKDAKPDLAIILDLPPQVGIDRQKAAGKTFDTMEQMSLEERGKVRDGFLAVAKQMPQALVVDANRSVEEIYIDIKAAVEKVLN